MRTVLYPLQSTSCRRRRGSPTNKRLAMFRKRAGRCCPLVSALVSRWWRRSKLGHGKQRNIFRRINAVAAGRSRSFYLKRRRRAETLLFQRSRSRGFSSTKRNPLCQLVTVIVRIKLTTRLSGNVTP